MSICSPGCACTVFLRGTELDPGPVMMASTGTNHGWGAESRSTELQVTDGSGNGVLMADGAKETLAAVRGRTLHRGGADLEREACELGLDDKGLWLRRWRWRPGRCGSGSGLLRQVWLRQQAAQARGDGAGQECRAREGALCSGAA